MGERWKEGLSRGRGLGVTADIQQNVQRAFSLTAPYPSPGWYERPDLMGRVRGGMKKSVGGGTFGPGHRWEGTGRVGWRAHPCSSSKILGRDPGVLRWKGRLDRQAREEPSDALTLQLHSHTSWNWVHMQVCRLGFCLIYVALWVFSSCEYVSWFTVHAQKPLLPIFVNVWADITTYSSCQLEII